MFGACRFRKNGSQHRSPFPRRSLRTVLVCEPTRPTGRARAQWICSNSYPRNFRETDRRFPGRAIFVFAGLMLLGLLISLFVCWLISHLYVQYCIVGRLSSLQGSRRRKGIVTVLLLRRRKQASIAPGSETLAGRKTSE